MAGRSKVSISYSGVGDMLRSDFMAAEMVRRAQKVADLARSRAPVYSGSGRDPHRGRYKDSFQVLGTRAGGRKHDRAAGIVVSNDPTAVFIEYGTQAHDTRIRDRNGRERTIHVPAMPARHVLGSSMMAAGD